MNLTLDLLTPSFVVARFPATNRLPAAIYESAWVFTARTDEELSLVCPEPLLSSAGVTADDTEHDWRCLKVAGPLDFALVGILAGLTAALAKESISLFAVSTFDTDYLLVKGDVLAGAIAALENSGCKVRSTATHR